MKAVIQRVKKAKVAVNEETEEIADGLVILVAVGAEDKDEDAEWLAEKCVNLRIFPGAEGRETKLDRSVLDIKGGIMAVSQFTLYGDCRKGRRPDFTLAAKPETAKLLYEKFVECLKTSGLRVVTGKFQSEMLVEIHNDGPVTLIVETAKKAVSKILRE